MKDEAKHEGLPVPGYRKQTDRNVDLVSKNNIVEEQMLRTIDALREDPNVDPRWLSIARTHFEQGFMAMNRSIFKPSRVSLPEDTNPNAGK